MKTTHYKIFLALLGLTVVIVSCTKVNRDDDFTPRTDIPPVPGGYYHAREVAKDNLIAYWAFDGGLTDSVTNTTGQNSGVGFDAGIKGQCYQGNSTSYFTFTPTAKLQQLKSYSISFWMNTSTSSGGAIGIFTLARTDDFWGNLDIYQDGQIGTDTAVFKVHMYNNISAPWSGQFNSSKVVFGQWSNIIITYNGANSVFTIYQNSVPIGISAAGYSAPTISPVLYNTDPKVSPNQLYGNLSFLNATKAAFGTFQFQTSPSLTNGAGSQSWAKFYTGKLDEFRIYDKVLSTTEVSALYKLEKDGR